MKPTDPNSRRESPSVAEIAALTRRLRELSVQGGEADPVERAAYLTDKDALLARIDHTQQTDTYIDDTETADQRHEHRVVPGRSMSAATDLPVWVMGEDGSGAGPPMPEWMREQAVRHEAAVTAGTAPPVRPGDPAELEARIEALRERIAARDAALPEDTETARREQLSRWHHDDNTDLHVTDETAPGHDTDVAARKDGSADQGWPR